MPEGLELVAEFDNEDPWVKIEKVADETNTYRVIVDGNLMIRKLTDASRLHVWLYVVLLTGRKRKLI